jgi:hypothetical protein
MFERSEVQFHGHTDRLLDRRVDRGRGSSSAGAEEVRKHSVVEERRLRYRFQAHFHPFVPQLIERLISGSVEGLEGADTEYAGRLPDGSPRPVLRVDTAPEYSPTVMVERPFPKEELDFSASGPYAVYNWELFFHVPLTLALHLSKNQRFEEARKWLHFIFDPTDDSDAETPQRFWKVHPFRTTDVAAIERALIALASGGDSELRRQMVDSIHAWMDSPFNPHAVARHRPWAYMLKTVMVYLDNLIAWGDSLFRQDTREAIQEATQLYVMAANLLGPKPQPVPKKGSVRPQTYAKLRRDLDELGNALRELETDIPFDLLSHPANTDRTEGLEPIRSLGQTLYFCVPRNEKLLSYWETVADRLFKVRNSLNIQGVFRQLPLFAPQIDPALLARAAASGLDVAETLSGMNQPLPLVRFPSVLARALEICREVRTLGSTLLGVIEKQDNEAFLVLRARQEHVMLSLAETSRYLALQEAIKAREAIEKSLATATLRYEYYERLLGRSGQIDLPQLDELDRASLEAMRFHSVEPEPAQRQIEIEIDPTSDVSAGILLNPEEARELERLTQAHQAQNLAAAMEVLAAEMNVIPGFSVNIQPFGCGGTISFGGSNIAAIFSAIGAAARANASISTFEANMAAKMGVYERRGEEWALQSNLAASEITQLFKQLRAAQIRQVMAEREWKNQQQQIRHAEEIERFLTQERNGKKTNEAFYAWLKREVKGLHSECFQLAHSMAKKAERALQHEIGDPSLQFIEPGYLSGNEALVAGEKLHFDLKRMETAYQDLNRREYELTKHVSLMQLNPRALIDLRITGRCAIEIPEEAFDLDGPGHYFRRLRTVAVSIPCVAGPYTTVSCTLTLEKSSIRRNPSLTGRGYEREGGEDDRFSDHYGNVQSVVTSTGLDDSGLFETSLRDDRYLPFEGSGALSSWRLELPPVRQFDYETISDVILHLKYTAREGGAQLRGEAVLNLENKIAAARAHGSVRLLSLRHDFPTEWAKLRSSNLPSGSRVPIAIVLRPEHYPIWARGRLSAMKGITVFARSTRPSIEVRISGEAREPRLRDGELAQTPNLPGLLSAVFMGTPLPGPLGSFTIELGDTAIEDLWLAIAWGT